MVGRSFSFWPGKAVPTMLALAFLPWTLHSEAAWGQDSFAGGYAVPVHNGLGTPCPASAH